jgi:hypothetical protein
MKIVLSIIFSIILISITTFKAEAYPTYIRLNYTSCLACHQSVEGGGALSSYGKGIAHAESFFGGEYKSPSTNSMMEHSVESRMMALSKLYDVNGKKNKIFPMQLDYTNVVKWRKDLRQEVTMAVAPSTGVKSHWTDRIYFRTFKLDYSLDKNNHLVVGGANLPLGIRLVDHTAYTRERNRLGVTDVPLQIQYINIKKDWQQTYLSYFPNPTDAVQNSEYGLATKQEFFPLTNLSLGAQALVAKGKSIDRDMLGFFTRTGKGSWAMLAEMDYTKRSLVNSNIKFDQWTSLLEADYYFKEYFRSSLGFQVLRVNNPFKAKEELYTFNNEFKISSHWSCIFEYRQKSTDVQLEKMVFGQVFFNWW